MAAAWCTLVNEDLMAMGRPPIEMVEIRTHRRRIAGASGKMLHFLCLFILTFSFSGYSWNRSWTQPALR
jgi:hypothetical protein